MITIRGNLTSEEAAKAVVHFKVPASLDGCHYPKPKCGNGSFHLKWTDKITQVTCPKCIKSLSYKEQLKIAASTLNYNAHRDPSFWD